MLQQNRRILGLIVHIHAAILSGRLFHNFTELTKNMTVLAWEIFTMMVSRIGGGMEYKVIRGQIIKLIIINIFDFVKVVKESVLIKSTMP